ncbi:unnamed protein product [Phaedon cochleariae]|uniref:Uncharacterized protein n=1 Tax=Phaedon cochleariae TaxID=80249 RepID=A0A9P0D985_PHACE|nr:unnamed protein product [Phaedon cochleariae]
MSSPEQENIMNNSHSQNQTIQSPLDVSHSYSVNTISSLRDYIISEDLLAGQRLEGRMSSVRRFFCLFVTFDFLFTCLMWIICVMLNGEYIITALQEQVVHYNIHTSLFDIVLIASCRFIMLIFFYALLYMNHWFIISLSTASTCGFLITKVFFYDWPHSSQPVFEVLLVLASFILAWGEAWFLDFKVIPQETHANRYLITDTERTPLIRSYVQGLPSMYTESIGNFYSPQGSPEGSMFRFDQSANVSTYLPVKFTKEQEDNYKRTASKVFHEAWDLFKSKDWKLQKQNENDSFFSRSESKGKKIFKVQAEISVSPRYLLEELFYQVHELPKWNPAIKESQRIQSLNEHTDITYQVSKEAAKGLVSSRDFVNLRHWAEIENGYMISVSKTDHPSIPVNKKIVRGENGVGCFVIEETSQTDISMFHWIMNTNLKIWIPSTILEKEVAHMMFTYIKDLRNHLYSKRSDSWVIYFFLKNMGLNYIKRFQEILEVVKINW